MFITVSTFNLRYAAADDGINCWNNRSPLVLESIRENAPDVIGFQEVLPQVRAFLQSELPEYTVIGTGRLKDFSDESVSVACRNDTVEIMTAETFWLSGQPDEPGSSFQGCDGWPRIATVVTVIQKSTSKRFRIFNTHLDHLYDEIRLKQAGVLEKVYQNYSKKAQLPSIITGDMNCTPESPVIGMLLHWFPDLLVDLTTPELIDSDFTYHDFFLGREEKKKIDYILVTEQFRHLGSWVDRRGNDGVYLSDHFPVYTKIDF